MQVRPLKRYPRPSYPAGRDVQSGKVREPRSVPALSRLLGAGLLLEVLLGEISAARADGKPTAVQTPAPPVREVSLPSARVAALVAPALAEALRDDGRGAFGCVAVNPPAFLAEDEAIEVIRDECAKAGLKLQAGSAVEKLRASDLSAPRLHSARGRQPKQFIRDEGEMEFDCVSEDLGVRLEYLSRDDYAQWMEPGGRGTGSCYDFPELYQKVAKALEERRFDRPVVCGLFFDPLVRGELERPELDGLDLPLQLLGRAEYVQAMNKARDGRVDRAKEKLRRQVRHFLDYLKEQKAKR